MGFCALIFNPGYRPSLSIDWIATLDSDDEKGILRMIRRYFLCLMRERSLSFKIYSSNALSVTLIKPVFFRFRLIFHGI